MGVENPKSNLSVMDKTLYLQRHPLQIHSEQYLMPSSIYNGSFIDCRTVAGMKEIQNPKTGGLGSPGSPCHQVWGQRPAPGEMRNGTGGLRVEEPK